MKWSAACQKAFPLIKKELVSEKILTTYNPELQILLSTNASSYGLSAILSHIIPDGEEKPIVSASRILTDSERNYSQIEEATAIYWGMHKFSQYIYGRQFKLITDHNVLIYIFKLD